ncbi:MAG: hypothetical protein WAZ14_01160 [Patescibacteria group bacterium]
MRKLLAVLALVTSLALPSLVSAQLSVDGSGLVETGGQAYGEQVKDPARTNIATFVGGFIIQPLIGLTGVVFLVLTVYAGLMWMTSAGDSKRIENAKNILVASVVGAVIIASAYVITSTVIDALSATPGSVAEQL